MNKQDFIMKTKFIKETFKDKRKIKCHLPIQNLRLDENIYQEGNIFITENDEIIDLELQITDFTEDELVKYVELAEALFETNRKHVSIYIICPNTVNVRVKECEIKSEADFSIKLACIEENPAHILLNIIKAKMAKGEMLDNDDLYALAMMPVICKKEERNYFRKEYFRIINEIHY
ncbi:hypothetical protein [Methanobrevibacter sp.]|uniref:hypothetical protein n=1 Tax=Methanobrevibacter sp. TaxID=66852 RepID=UPI0026DF07DB|nr:hypothetical protein [Methanobrevibacter sp.]MDO5823086.1 hypothetical protein [Methanobrevibacter sp.]